MNQDNDDDLLITNESESESETEIDSGDLSKYIIPYRHNYKSNIMSFNYWTNNNVFVPVSGHFEIHYQCYGQILNVDRQQRMISFIEGIEGGFFVPSTSDINPVFCNGTIKNISFEMPTREISIPNMLTFLYYKTCAMVGEYADILMFKFTPTFDNNSIYVDIGIHESTNPYIDEEEWMDEIIESTYGSQNDLDTTSEEVEGHSYSSLEEVVDDYENEFIENLLPWWHRDDGSTRDYYYGNITNQPTIQVIMQLHEVPKNEFKVYPLFYDEDGNPVIFDDLDDNDSDSNNVEETITDVDGDDIVIINNNNNNTQINNSGEERRKHIIDVGDISPEETIDALERFKQEIANRQNASANTEDDIVIIGNNHNDKI